MAYSKLVSLVLTLLFMKNVATFQKVRRRSAITLFFIFLCFVFLLIVLPPSWDSEEYWTVHVCGELKETLTWLGWWFAECPALAYCRWAVIPHRDSFIPVTLERSILVCWALHHGWCSWDCGVCIYHFLPYLEIWSHCTFFVLWFVNHWKIKHPFFVLHILVTVRYKQLGPSKLILSIMNLEGQEEVKVFVHIELLCVLTLSFEFLPDMRVWEAYM